MSVREAYLSGSTTFMGLDLAVAPGALVPRLETELLGRTALDRLQAITPSGRVADMCCGVGNLACAIAHHAPDVRVWAADLTEACVALARQNVARHALESRVSIHRGDLFDALAGLALEGTIDLIVCNPPYISDRRLESDGAHLLQLEPREAFAAGPYGLDIHLRVADQALGFLRPGGVLMFEAGLGQDRQVTRLLQRKGYADISVVRNGAGEGRVVVGVRPPTPAPDR